MNNKSIVKTFMVFSKKFKKIKRSFTILELLIVIAIIAILSSVVLVNLRFVRNKAKDTAIIDTMRQLNIQAYFIFERDGNYNKFCCFEELFDCDKDVIRLCKKIALLGGKNPYSETEEFGPGISVEELSPPMDGLKYVYWGEVILNSGKIFCIDYKLSAVQFNDSTPRCHDWTPIHCE